MSVYRRRVLTARWAEWFYRKPILEDVVRDPTLRKLLRHLLGCQHRSGNVRIVAASGAIWCVRCHQWVSEERWRPRVTADQLEALDVLADALEERGINPKELSERVGGAREEK